MRKPVSLIPDLPYGYISNRFSANGGWRAWPIAVNEGDHTTGHLICKVGKVLELVETDIVRIMKEVL